MTDRGFGIGIVVTNLPGDQAGGAQLQALRMARELSARHRVKILTRGRPEAAAGLGLEGVELVLREPPPIAGVRLLADARMAVDQIRRRRHEIDVLVCYQTLASGLVGAMARRLGTPYFVYIRGRREYDAPLLSQYRYLTPLILRTADRVLVQADGIARELLHTYDHWYSRSLHRRLTERTRVIPNGVDERPVRTGSGSYFVYVGRLVFLKGVDVLLAALRNVPGVELTIVGDGPERGRLEAMARGLPVSFVGHVPHVQALAYIERAMCLVLPSRTEAFSNVILESLSMGVPVIATSVGGNRELVRPGESGYLVPPDDPRALAEAMGRISGAAEEERRAMGARAHRSAAAYPWSQAARLLVREITAVVGDRPSPTG